MQEIADDFLSRMLGKTLETGGDYADVFVEHDKPLSIHLEDNKIEKVSTGVDAGVGVRVIFGEKSAYAYTNDFSPASLMHVAEAVSRAVKEQARKDISLNLTTTRPDVDFTIGRMPGEVAVQDKIAMLRKANECLGKVSPKVRQASIFYRDSKKQVCVATSDGTIARDDRIYTLALIQVIAAEGDILQTGYEPIGGLTGFELFQENSLEDLAVRAAKKAVAMLSARKAPGGRMPVVISSEAGGTMIHEAVGHGLEADLAQQGLSVYSGKLGKQIASPPITIIDDATIAGKRGSYRFDDEGAPSRRTVLVEKGVLKSYMYDRLTSRKDGVPSTANGRRQSYRYRPIPRMSNTFIAAGEDDADSIIRSVEQGFFVKKMGGGQVNTVTGEFVFEVSEGYMIQKGLVGDPVRGATLIGSGPDVLGSIDMVAGDMGFAIGTCGKDAQGIPVSDGMPTVRIPEMVIGGEV